MFLLHVVIFFGLIAWWIYTFDAAHQYKSFRETRDWLRSYRSYEYAQREAKSVGQRKYVLLKWSAPILMLAYLAGNWSLWDTAWGWSSLVVVRNGQVVEMGRTVVWTGDSTTTRIVDRPYHPKEISFGVRRERQSETAIRVLMHARPNLAVSDRDWVQMELDGRDGSEFAPREITEKLIRDFKGDSGSVNEFLREKLPAALAKHGWLLHHVYAVELPKEYSYAY